MLRMHSKGTIVAVFASALALVASIACAAAPLTFSVLEAAPYGAHDASGRPQGIYPDLLRALAAEIGQPATIKVVPFARAAQMVISGEADATLMFKTSVLEQSAVALTPVFSTELVVQWRPGLHGVTHEHMSSMLIGRIRGGCKELEQSPGIRFYELNSQEQGIKMLLGSRIDGFCTAGRSLRAARQRFDPQHLIDERELLVVARNEVWLFARKGLAAATSQQMVAGMKKLIANGSVERIVVQP